MCVRGVDKYGWCVCGGVMSMDGVCVAVGNKTVPTTSNFQVSPMGENYQIYIFSSTEDHYKICLCLK